LAAFLNRFWFNSEKFFYIKQMLAQVRARSKGEIADSDIQKRVSKKGGSIRCSTSKHHMEMWNSRAAHNRILAATDSTMRLH
jgi:hypothetical protein